MSAYRIPVVLVTYATYVIPDTSSLPEINLVRQNSWWLLCVIYMATIPWTLAYSHAGLIVQHTVYKALPLRTSLEGRHFSTPMFCLFEERTPIYLAVAFILVHAYFLKKRSETRPGDSDFSTITIMKRWPFTIVNSISIVPSKSACINIYHWWQWRRRWL